MPQRTNHYINGYLVWAPAKPIGKEMVFTKEQRQRLWAQFSDKEKEDIANICKTFDGKLG